MPWTDGLVAGTPAYEIAASDSQNIRVIAGPGTGKSFAMKRRVARLLESGANPHRILPVTFTRVAAEDLHRELVGMNTPGCESLHGTTLHGLAMRILMRNHVLATTGRIPRVLNRFELEPLLCDLVAHGGKRIVKKLLQAYEAAWARLQYDEPGFVQSPEDLAFSQSLLAWMQFHEAMLIGEAIPQLYRYLRDNPLAAERSEFSHLLVDEYQDLNRAEQGVLDYLADHAETCIVGDDDQSIYSFKHAHPEGIRDWLGDHPGASDFELTSCRRCPNTVVSMANSLIGHNQQRVARNLLPYPPNGDGVVGLLQYGTLDQEVQGVANLVSDQLAAGVPPGEILVLAQRGVIGTPIYQALRERFIPVRSYYAETELDLVDTQRRFALLKLFVSREDRVALRWLVGVAGHNWNAAGYKRVRNHCDQTGDSPWQALEKIASGEISVPYTAGIAAAFEELRNELDAFEQAPSLAAAIDLILPDGDPSHEELRSLALATLDEIGEGDDREEFMRLLNQAITQPEVPSEVHDVRIMSLHKSKGLSAPVTIVAGCTEGLLPQRPEAGMTPAERAADLEEQRRLFFVAITRVKAVPAEQKPGTLLLTYSTTMPLATAMGAGISPAYQQFGTAILQASRFLAELGPAAPAPVAG